MRKEEEREGVGREIERGGGGQTDGETETDRQTMRQTEAKNRQTETETETEIIDNDRKEQFCTVETYLDSGHEKRSLPSHPSTHTEEVAVILIKDARRAFIGWVAVSFRIITSKFMTNMENNNIEVV